MTVLSPGSLRMHGALLTFYVSRADEQCRIQNGAAGCTANGIVDEGNVLHVEDLTLPHASYRNGLPILQARMFAWLREVRLVEHMKQLRRSARKIHLRNRADVLVKRGSNFSGRRRGIQLDRHTFQMAIDYRDAVALRTYTNLNRLQLSIDQFGKDFRSEE